MQTCDNTLTTVSPLCSLLAGIILHLLPYFSDTIILSIEYSPHLLSSFYRVSSDFMAILVLDAFCLVPSPVVHWNLLADFTHNRKEEMGKDIEVIIGEE